MKNFFQSKKEVNNLNIPKKNYSGLNSLDPKKVAAINKLLNRVKLDKKIEIKKQITFYLLVVLTISLAGTLMSIIK